MLTALARFFRISLSKGSNIIPIGDEIEHARNYLTIQKMRYKNKFSADISVEPGVEKLYTIKLIIQPILENAIYHGMEYADGDGEIHIRAFREEETVVIEVEDNGPGMSEEIVEQLLKPTRDVSVPKAKGSGIGFRNVHQRIQLTFGSAYGLTIRSEPDNGTVVRICLPVLEEEDAGSTGRRGSGEPEVLLQLVLPLIGLSVLFWLLAFAPGDKHHQPALLEMSVILRDGDGNVSAMRKGMEQAAKDLNVELRFLTPAEDDSAVEQVQLLEHEVSGAAPAILLIPADREALGEAVSAAAGKTTLVTVESDMTAWGADASISMDHQALGEALGKAALNGVPFGGTVLLLDSLPGDNGVRERMEAAKALLEEKGRQVRIYRWTSDSTAFANILRIERPKAVIAFEAAALTEMAELSRGEEAFPLLYGCGSTASIAAALEKGRVTAIAAVNVFSAGYLAVEAAAKLARHESWTGASSVGFSVVRQETMYSSDNQKLLFPVT